MTNHTIKAVLFHSNSRPPARTIQASDFCETKFKTGGKKRKKEKKNVPSSFFPAKMGLNSSEPSTRTAHDLPCLHTQ